MNLNELENQIVPAFHKQHNDAPHFGGDDSQPESGAKANEPHGGEQHSGEHDSLNSRVEGIQSMAMDLDSHAPGYIFPTQPTHEASKDFPPAGFSHATIARPVAESIDIPTFKYGAGPRHTPGKYTQRPNMSARNECENVLSAEPPLTISPPKDTTTTARHQQPSITNMLLPTSARDNIAHPYVEAPLLPTFQQPQIFRHSIIPQQSSRAPAYVPRSTYDVKAHMHPASSVTPATRPPQIPPIHNQHNAAPAFVPQSNDNATVDTRSVDSDLPVAQPISTCHKPGATAAPLPKSRLFEPVRTTAAPLSTSHTAAAENNSSTALVPTYEPPQQAISHAQRKCTGPVARRKSGCAFREKQFGRSVVPNSGNRPFPDVDTSGGQSRQKLKAAPIPSTRKTTLIDSGSVSSHSSPAFGDNPPEEAVLESVESDEATRYLTALDSVPNFTVRPQSFETSPQGPDMIDERVHLDAVKTGRLPMQKGNNIPRESLVDARENNRKANSPGALNPDGNNPLHNREPMIEKSYLQAHIEPSQPPQSRATSSAPLHQEGFTRQTAQNLVKSSSMAPSQSAREIPRENTEPRSVSAMSNISAARAIAPDMEQSNSASMLLPQMGPRAPTILQYPPFDNQEAFHFNHSRGVSKVNRPRSSRVTVTPVNRPMHVVHPPPQQGLSRNDFYKIWQRYDAIFEKYDESLERATAQDEEIKRLKGSEDESQKEIEELQEEKRGLEQKLKRLGAMCSTYKEHMNKVVDAQKVLKVQAKELRETSTQAINAYAGSQAAVAKISKTLEEVKEMRACADTVVAQEQSASMVLQKGAVEAAEKLEKVTKEKVALEAQLEDSLKTNNIFSQEIEARLLDLARERHNTEHLQSLLFEQREAHSDLFNLMQKLPGDITHEIAKDQGVLASLLASGNAIQVKLDETAKLVGELRDHEMQPSEAFVILLNDLFHKHAPAPSQSIDNASTREEFISELFQDLKGSLNQFSIDNQTYIDLKDHILKLQETNSHLITDNNSHNLKTQELLRQLEDSRRELSNFSEKLQAKDRDLEAQRALPKENPELLAKIKRLEDMNTNIQGKLNSAEQEADRARKLPELEEKFKAAQDKISQYEKKLQEARDDKEAEIKRNAEIAEKVKTEDKAKHDHAIKSLRRLAQANATEGKIAREELEKQKASSACSLSEMERFRSQLANQEEKLRQFSSAQNLLEDICANPRSLHPELPGINQKIQANSIATESRVVELEQHIKLIDKGLINDKYNKLEEENLALKTQIAQLQARYNEREIMPPPAARKTTNNFLSGQPSRFSQQQQVSCTLIEDKESGNKEDSRTEISETQPSQISGTCSSWSQENSVPSQPIMSSAPRVSTRQSIPRKAREPKLSLQKNDAQTTLSINATSEVQLSPLSALSDMTDLSGLSSEWDSMTGQEVFVEHKKRSQGKNDAQQSSKKRGPPRNRISKSRQFSSPSELSEHTTKSRATKNSSAYIDTSKKEIVPSHRQEPQLKGVLKHGSLPTPSQKSTERVARPKEQKHETIIISEVVDADQGRAQYNRLVKSVTGARKSSANAHSGRSIPPSAYPPTHNGGVPRRNSTFVLQGQKRQAPVTSDSRPAKRVSIAPHPSGRR